MPVFPSEVALEMSLRLERRVGPIAEIREAASPTSSLPLSEPRLGQQILTSERIGARPETQGIVSQIQEREKRERKKQKERLRYERDSSQRFECKRDGPKILVVGCLVSNQTHRGWDSKSHPFPVSKGLQIL